MIPTISIDLHLIDWLESFDALFDALFDKIGFVFVILVGMSLVFVIVPVLFTLSAKKH